MLKCLLSQQMKITATCAIRFSYCKISPLLKMLLYIGRILGEVDVQINNMIETYSWSLQILNFCRTFFFLSQPSRAAVKHNVTLYGLGLCGRSVPKTVLQSFSRKCLKMVTASSAAFSDTWNCPCSGITDCLRWLHFPRAMFCFG